MTPTAYALRDVKMRYGPRTVLRIGELHVQDGEVLALVGPSGAGQSALLRLLALLEPPSAGRVSLHLDRREVTYASAARDNRRQIAMVFQRPALLSQSVRANVGYGLRVRGRRDEQERINAMLARVDLLALAEARPRTLSGGELQRVALARAFILAPRILLLDEPTANLDPYNVGLIEGLVREQNTHFATTTILVTLMSFRRGGSRRG